MVASWVPATRAYTQFRSVISWTLKWTFIHPSAVWRLDALQSQSGVSGTLSQHALSRESLRTPESLFPQLALLSLYASSSASWASELLPTFLICLSPQGWPHLLFLTNPPQPHHLNLRP